MKERMKSKKKKTFSFCLPLRLDEDEFEKNLLFLYNVQHVIVLWSLFISDYNLARKTKWKY